MNDRQSLKNTNKFFYNSFERELSIEYERISCQFIYDLSKLNFNDDNNKTIKILTRMEYLQYVHDQEIIPLQNIPYKKIRYLELGGCLYNKELKNETLIKKDIIKNLDDSICKMNNLISIDLTDTSYTPTIAMKILNKLKNMKKIVIIIKVSKNPTTKFFENLNKLIENNKDLVIVIQKEDYPGSKNKNNTIFSYDNKMPAWLSNY